jgi:hypothetical protein
MQAATLTHRPLLDTARRYLAAGLSVLPIRPDGSKAPALDSWDELQERQPSLQELADWFGGPQEVGIGVVCGKASGNLLVLDVETEAAWLSLRDLAGGELLSELAACPVVRTPRGGRHVWMRLRGPAAGTVLARRRDGKRPLIETRGRGHQVLAPGCPPACHPDGGTYEFVSRGWLGG